MKHTIEGNVNHSDILIIKEDDLRGRAPYERHRDVHGAGNILSQYLHGKFLKVMMASITYLRPVQVL
ncbi:hypothetical protein [Priestia abyssalis]|uniref:hypothetical protein n=1 Tax=Priestia abyssalis TaxID=1221450 RepID=UPI0011173173|nr:hypothetical protein [Priestia abyssalis]